VYFEAVCRNSPKILNALFAKHDDPLVVGVYLNYRKCKRSPKFTKLVEVSCDRMWRL